MSLMNELNQHRLVAIVRGTDADASIAASLTLLEAGLRVLEIAITTPDALRVIETVAKQAPADAWIGAGTVLEPEQVVSVREAGARFIVTPAVTRSIAFAAERGIPSLCGAYTATEALDAMDRGASAVKLFPAFVGGPKYLTALREPLPNIPFIPVGGVGADQVAEYFERGAVALGLGGPLLGDAAKGGDLEALRARATAFIAAEQATR
ncbi:bifunctional 4-hydroxy-2-oxoglutarate aldolase/2-dehydro-3-deoxy-phosphogluconate aldolase [Lysinibacter cavernae]|uniref:2-dehydro-3-deoxyphosphogluconate aldolase/(4S)-4-hydroxy-2-oxoglutarate aldolase n=1 Tax=Lysinibacter cavernae TaxID=1640652 RepID=A0A7X5QYG9_9MICO|nr:bifunctional 4-hydroxy-2-oxoglutarate aldolase/2-dehydro-3-deoxy-phosphogluconate aldolase [Lysinibacter cavernae]NIH52272.1 2-dehydro-3-deoxyphosphogluconate aldolase/(4S)-4-hydroxy-2-oxoglutarate aldolase [Lysinibacter cavernae]